MKLYAVCDHKNKEIFKWIELQFMISTNISDTLISYYSLSTHLLGSLAGEHSISYPLAHMPWATWTTSVQRRFNFETIGEIIHLSTLYTIDFVEDPKTITQLMILPHHWPNSTHMHSMYRENSYSSLGTNPSSDWVSKYSIISGKVNVLIGTAQAEVISHFSALNVSFFI